MLLKELSQCPGCTDDRVGVQPVIAQKPVRQRPWVVALTNVQVSAVGAVDVDRHRHQDALLVGVVLKTLTAQGVHAPRHTHVTNARTPRFMLPQHLHTRESTHGGRGKRG